MTGTPGPPPIPGEVPSFPPAASYRYRSRLSTLVSVLLAINAAMSLALIGSTISEMDLLERARGGGRFTFEEVAANDQRQAAISAGGVAAFAIAAFAWLLWQHRAHSNLRALGIGGLRFTPGWAIGWWFVPLANLVRPAQVMSELVRASETPDESVGPVARATPRIVWIWWVIWVIGGLMTYGIILRSAEDLASLLTRDRLVIASEGLHAIAAILAIAIVRRVQRSQSKRAVRSAG